MRENGAFYKIKKNSSFITGNFYNPRNTQLNDHNLHFFYCCRLDGVLGQKNKASKRDDLSVTKFETLMSEFKLANLLLNSSQLESTNQ